jgi:hypothetical protein
VVADRSKRRVERGGIYCRLSARCVDAKVIEK